MPVRELQIQLHQQGIGRFRASIDHPGIRLNRQIAVDSPNYLFLYLSIEEDVEPGSFTIALSDEVRSFSLEQAPAA